MTAFIPRPNTPEAAPSVLIVLDVDGVLNQLMPETRDGDEGEWVTRRDGHSFRIRADVAVVEALDEQLKREGVGFGWLTTWDADVDLLIEGPFQGRLAGGYIVAARPNEIFIASDWKLRALLDHLDELGHPAYVWADDDAVKEAVLFRPAFASATGRGGGVRLLLSTEKEMGLTLKDVGQIREFIDCAVSGP